MGIYIKIDKVIAVDNVYYYKVKTDLSGKLVFYIGIDAINKTISFYWNDDFKDSIAIIALTKKEEVLNIPIISPAVYLRVILQAYRAIEKNEFPQCLDYSA